jgi:flagellar basal-body rod protein FlgB
MTSVWGMMKIEINNLSNSSNTYDLLKKGLDAASTRSEVIANNIANINTAGYKRYYVNFEDSLKNSMNNIELKKTDPKHIDETSSSDIQVLQDNSSSMKADGNNVDINTEMVDQSTNSLMYNALVTQINSRLQLTSYIISGK